MTARTWDEVRRRRLERHHLLSPAPRERLVDVVGELCGVQAQVMANAELALGLRVDGITRRDVRDALWERRSLVKTYGVRGTIHLFPSDELAMWLSAIRAAPTPNRSAALASTGTSHAEVATLVRAIGNALDRRTMTREDLGREVIRRAGRWAGDEVVPAFGSMWPRWTLAIGAAAHAGVLCFGPNQGNRITFVQPERWLGSFDPGRGRDGHDALTEVLRRFLRAYGPATVREFARWFNMEPNAAADAVRSLGDEVAEVDVEGHRSLQLADESNDAPPAAFRTPLRLLAPFDVFVIGSFPRDRLIPAGLLDRLGRDRIGAPWARRVLAGGTVANIPVLLRDGVVAGVWERRRSGGKVLVRVEPFDEPPAVHRRVLEAEAERIGRVLEADVAFELGPVDVRPHL
jgi:hypothetical protein